MTDDRGKTKRDVLIDRAGKAKGRVQQSLPEIQHLIKTSGAVEVAQSIFRQFADDIQLKDLLAKAESLVANTNRTFSKAAPKDVSPAQTFRSEAPSSEPSGKSAIKKSQSKKARPKKAAPKKTSSTKKKTRTPKRRAKARS
jgi:hypothetical protein